MKLKKIASLTVALVFALCLMPMTVVAATDDLGCDFASSKTGSLNGVDWEATVSGEINADGGLYDKEEKMTVTVEFDNTARKAGDFTVTLYSPTLGGKYKNGYSKDFYVRAKEDVSETITFTFNMPNDDLGNVTDLRIEVDFDEYYDRYSYYENQMYSTPQLYPSTYTYYGSGDFTIDTSGFYNYFDPNRSLYANSTKLTAGVDYDYYSRGGYLTITVFENTMRSFAGSVRFRATFTNGSSSSVNVEIANTSYQSYYPSEVSADVPKTGDTMTLQGMLVLFIVLSIFAIARRIRARAAK